MIVVGTDSVCGGVRGPEAIMAGVVIVSEKNVVVSIIPVMSEVVDAP